MSLVLSHWIVQQHVLATIWPDVFTLIFYHLQNRHIEWSVRVYVLLCCVQMYVYIPLLISNWCDSHKMKQSNTHQKFDAFHLALGIWTMVSFVQSSTDDVDQCSDSHVFQSVLSDSIRWSILQLATAQIILFETCMVAVNMRNNSMADAINSVLEPIWRFFGGWTETFQL